MDNILSSWTWTFPQSSQLHITAKLNPNQNYQALAKDFLEKYANSMNIGIGFIENYYNNDTPISLHIHNGQNNQLYEIMGHTNFKNKLSEFNINVIKLFNIVFTSQPLGKNSIIITTNSQSEINGKKYSNVNTFIVRIKSGIYKITNHLFEIFI